MGAGAARTREGPRDYGAEVLFSKAYVPRYIPIEMHSIHARLLIVLLLVCTLPFRVAAAQDALHPDMDGPGWTELFAPDLSNALGAGDVWTFDDGILTASEDVVLWTGKVFDDFVLDLEFRTASGTNSGVFVHGSDLTNPVPYSVEVQIADDYAAQWANAPASWRAGAIFGHLPARKRTVRQPGSWNRFTITCRGSTIMVVLNGALVNVIDLTRWKSSERNPDGTEIPGWLSVPLADLPTHGHVGLQGKHASAPIWFRKLRIKELK